jgi:hypothetical protein
MRGKPGLGTGAVPVVANTSPSKPGGMADSATSANEVLVPDGQVAASKAVSHPRFR